MKNYPIIKQFKTIDLSEMEGVKLMDRVDTKYTFSIDKLDGILSKIVPYYKVLKVNDVLASQYHTLYFDTKDLLLYNCHQSGRLNRYKIRHRLYVESELGFLEVKFKNNKGRTIKQRIIKKIISTDWEEDSEKFLKVKTPYEPSELLPAISVNYKRLTFVNIHSAERLTIDLDLQFITNDYNKTFQNLIIAEVKQEGKSKSPFIKLMKTLHIREGSLSKYCMGIAMTYKNVKTNNFKSKLHSINKILQE